MNSKSVRINLDLSPQLDLILEGIANKSHCSKADILKKAIALMGIISEAKDRNDGCKFGIVEKNQELHTEIVGV